jgi:2-dehydropantoate 2-reductase
MRIAILGAGSIGLYYGAKLARVGYDVRFLMRSGLEAARSHGVAVFSQDGDFSIESPQVFGSPDEIGPVDLAIVALKATDNAVLERIVPPVMGPATTLLTLQNGLGNEDFLAERFGGGSVMGGLCFVCLTRRSPTVVDHFGHGSLTVGEAFGSAVDRTRAVAQAFRAAGVETNVTDDLLDARWRKLVWNIPFNGLAVAAGGVTVDVILADPALRARCDALMRETVAIAAAYGRAIPQEFLDYQITRTVAMGPYKPSTLVDWLAGNPLEIEPIWGEPLRRARAAGVETPELERVLSELHKRGAAS